MIRLAKPEKKRSKARTRAIYAKPGIKAILRRLAEVPINKHYFEFLTGEEETITGPH